MNDKTLTTEQQKQLAKVDAATATVRRALSQMRWALSDATDLPDEYRHAVAAKRTEMRDLLDAIDAEPVLR